MTVTAYYLQYDADLIDEFDVDHVAEFVRVAELIVLAGLNLPDEVPVDGPVLAEASWEALDEIDFPNNNSGWPIMSLRMLDVLAGVGSLPRHRLIPVRMIDDSVPDAERTDLAGRLRPEVLRDDFVGFHVLEHDGRLDWGRSDCEQDPDIERFARPLRSMVLQPFPNGMPPVFRVDAAPFDLFVSPEAKAALEAAGIGGVVYMPIGSYTVI